MARITLAQRDDGQQAIVKAPDSGDVCDSGALQMLPDVNIVRVVAPANGTQRRRAGENRILPVIDALDAHYRFRTLVSVIAGPFAERSFVGGFFTVRWDHALDDDLSLGRHRQATFG